MSSRPFTVFLIAGEESGDHLGARLMEELKGRVEGDIRFLGVGGERMKALGVDSLFPMQEINYTGVSAIIANLHRILGKIREATKAVVEADPDVLIIIDCPGFNLEVAKRVRKKNPKIPIVEYVSPTVWVWRPGRAKWMSEFVDQVLAVLPFEPEVHQRLGGPACTYVGHPLTQRLDKLRPGDGERKPLDQAERPVLLVLPGSRHGEVKRLTDVFGETVAKFVSEHGPIEVVLPAVSRLEEDIRSRTARWPVQPTIISGENAKYAAFRRAHLALAASGTVTLELALSGVPMVVAYRVDPFVKPFKYALKRINSFVLANLITGSNEIPEFLDGETTPENMSVALAKLLDDNTVERQQQLAAFARLDDLMAIEGGTPSSLAADAVMRTLEKRGRQGCQTGT